MKIKIKRSVQFAAIIAVVTLTSCAKDNLTPGGVLGDPGLPGNGTVSGSPGHSADHQQRQGSFSDGGGLNFNYPSTDVALNAQAETQAK